MSKYLDIKTTINQLDGGAFHNLCDVYLSSKGYKNLHSYGVQSGTNKSIKGNPDTYFVTANGKYIFALYTTQQTNFVNKAMEDITNCIKDNEPGIDAADIIEIILCYTFTRLSPEDNERLISFCREKGIQLNTFGLDQIATDIYLQYQRIARDFLGIPLDTGQIFTKDSFIASNDSNTLAAPLATEFVFRDDEITEAIRFLEENDILIITGPAGVGKTRFALEICSQMESTYSLKGFYIRSNNLEIYEDINETLGNTGEFILVIDDANELRGFQHILGFLLKQNKDFTIKLIVTVRDYARENVIKSISQIIQPKILKLNPFTDEEISQLMDKCFGIKNYSYIRKIINISEGNARLAMLAGKLAYEENELIAINDASQLYDNYYSQHLDNILSNGSSLIFSIGILSFFNAVNLSNIGFLEPLLNERSLSTIQFIEDIKQLQAFELVDIYNDTVARIADQSFGNFLLKYCFIDKKLLSLRFMINQYYSDFPSRTIENFNMLIKVFSNENVKNTLNNDINRAWDDIVDDSKLFKQFLKAFHTVRPTETMMLMKDRINNQTSTNFDPAEIDFKREKNNKQITNEVIDILKDYSLHPQLPTAIDLLLDYYELRPDLFMQFYCVFSLYYGIDKDSQRFNFYTQVAVLEHFSRRIENNPTDNLKLLFIRIAAHYLQFTFNTTESGRNNSIIFYDVSLKYSVELTQYRIKIWEFLFSLYKSGKFTELIEDILNDYGQGFGSSVDNDIVRAEFYYVVLFFKELLDPDTLHHSIIAEKQINLARKIGERDLKELKKYLKNPSYQIFKALNIDVMDGNKSIQEREAESKERLSSLIADYSEEEIEFLFQTCQEIEDITSVNTYWIQKNLAFIFSELSSRSELFLHSVRQYFIYNTPLKIGPQSIVSQLMNLLPSNEVYDLINSCEYSQQNFWLWVFFISLPAPEINETFEKNVFELLKKPISSQDQTPYRPIFQLSNFAEFNDHFLIKASTIILDHYENSPFTFSVYFSMMINSSPEKHQSIINIYQENISLLYEIYFKDIEIQKNDDRNGSLLTKLIKLDSNILNKYLDIFIEKIVDGSFSSLYTYSQRLDQIWLKDDYFDEIDNMINYILERTEAEYLIVRIFLEKLLQRSNPTPTITTRQYNWLEHAIEKQSQNTDYIIALFNSICELDSDVRRSLIIKLIILNPNPELFINLRLEPSSVGGTGSMIPYMRERVKFLSSLLPELSGLKFLHHRQRVESDIKDWEKRIETEEINELINSI